MSSVASTSNQSAPGTSNTNTNTAPIQSIKLVNAPTRQLFPIEPLKNQVKLDLIKILDKISGEKILILDVNLSGPLSLLIEFTFLKEHGIKKVYYLNEDPIPIPPSDSNGSIYPGVIFLCRPSYQNIQSVANQVLAHSTLSYVLALVSHKTVWSEKQLEDLGVLGSLIVAELNLGLIPLEEDVLSLESDKSFRQLNLDKDTSSLFSMGESLMKIQDRLGYFNRIMGKGDNAQVLNRILTRLRLERDCEESDGENRESDSNPVQPSYQLDTLILLDRSSDMITPLLTQLTYEGLIDETFGIKNTLIEFDPDQVPNQAPKPRKIPLNSQDSFYSHLRDLNFANIGNALNNEAKRLSQDYEGRKHAKTVQEIKQFVSKMGTLKSDHLSLKLHTSLAEKIMDSTQTELFNDILEVEQNLVGQHESGAQVLPLIQDLMCEQEDMLKVLRLICLQSNIANGLKPKVYDQYQTEFCQTYGYHHTLTFHNLSKVGILIRKSDTSSRAPVPYPALSKGFKLVVDEVDERDPSDISYVYSGYAPLSARLIQTGLAKSDKMGYLGSQNPLLNLGINQIYQPISKGINNFASHIPGVAGGSNLNRQADRSGRGNSLDISGNDHPLGPGWSQFKDLLTQIPGSTFDEIVPFRNVNLSSQSHSGVQSNQLEKVIMVAFLGGCTYTEISSIRFLKKMYPSYKFIVITNEIINGSKWLDQFVEPGLVGFQNRN